MREMPPEIVFDEPLRIERGRGGAIILNGPDGVRVVLSRRAAGLSHDGLGCLLGRGRVDFRPAGRSLAVQAMVAALLVPMVWIVLAGIGLALAVTVMPVRAAREWLPALALAVLAVSAWLAWMLAPRLILAGKQWHGGPQVAPPRVRPHLRVVK